MTTPTTSDSGAPRDHAMDDTTRDRAMRDHAMREPTGDELLAGELTAALFVASGAAADDDPLPDLLAARLVHTGEALVRTGALTAAPARTPTAAQPTRTRTRARFVTWSGWLAAAALLAVMLRPGGTPRAPATAVVPVPDAATALRDSLVADSTATRLAFGAGTDSTGRAVQGEVTWDARGQRGVLRLAGLPANDRSRWQYQLWIVDAERDERYPVDGGVFDAPAGAGAGAGQKELLVPVHPRVTVGRAALFVITVERPGGVVVSDRSRVTAIARAPEAAL